MATVNAGRITFVSKGEYGNSTEYNKFDVVNYNGNSYFAKATTIGNLPTNTTYWQLIAEKGNTGPDGPTGNGIASITKTGTSGLVDTYTITYTNGNTTTFTITNGEVTEQHLDEELKFLADVLPTDTAEGETIDLTDSAKYYFKEVVPEGQTSQVSTIGKNLASNETSGNKIIGGVPFTIEKGIIKINGTTASSNVNFYFKSFQTNSGNALFWVEISGYTDKESGNASIILQESSDNSTWSTKADVNLSSTTGKQSSVILDNTKYYRVRWYGSSCVYTNATLKIQLEYGTDKTSFEPYTGGIPRTKSILSISC